jgi:hypothetical protein
MHVIYAHEPTPSLRVLSTIPPRPRASHSQPAEKLAGWYWLCKCAHIETCVFRAGLDPPSPYPVSQSYFPSQSSVAVVQRLNPASAHQRLSQPTVAVPSPILRLSHLVSAPGARRAELASPCLPRPTPHRLRRDSPCLRRWLPTALSSWAPICDRGEDNQRFNCLA